MLKPFGLHEVLTHQIDFRRESFGAMNEAIAERRLKTPFATMRPITMTYGPNLVGVFCTEQGRIKVSETPYYISISTVARLPADAAYADGGDTQAVRKFSFTRIWDFAPRLLLRFPRLRKTLKSRKQAPIPATDTQDNALLSGLAKLDFSSMNTDQRYSVLEQLIAVLLPGTHLSEIGRSMFCDYEFRQYYEKSSIKNYRSYDRKFAMREFARLAMNREGAFAECGVFKGASAYILAKELQRRKPDRLLHLYDSFQGLSSPGSLDGTHWTKGDLSGRLDEVQSNLKDVAVQIVYHQGWIPDCFDENSEQMFSFVHIDVDLHQPTLDALQYFYPRMSPRGIILSDDYGFETCPGARKAFDDFFRDKKETVMHLPTGQGVVICNI
jgi:O-methyltransferase